MKKHKSIFDHKNRTEAWSSRVSSSHSQSFMEFTPTPENVSREILKLQRPKTTSCLTHSRSKIPSDIEAKTRPASAFHKECERVLEVEYEPTRRHNFQNHLGIRKSKPPPWQKDMNNQIVQVQKGHGYEYLKSKDKLTVTIHTESLNSCSSTPPEVSPVPISSRNFHHSHRQSAGTPDVDSTAKEVMILQLQQQINSLNVYLEDERIQHKENLKQAEEYASKRLEEVLAAEREKRIHLEESYDKEVTEIKESHRKEKLDTRNNYEAKISKMQGEIEFLQSSFEAYKRNLQEELTEKWIKERDNLISKHEAELERETTTIRSTLTDERNAERTKMIKEHSREVDMIKSDSKKELESLNKRYANAAKDIETIVRLTKELDNLKNEHDKLNESYDKCCLNLANITRELTDTKLQLMDFQQKFNEKVTAVDEKYQFKVDDLMRQNSDMRKLYMKKCGELNEKRLENDANLSNRVVNAKDTMKTIINSRNKALVDMASRDAFLCIPDKQPKDRPTSAPITKGERVFALTTSGETNMEDFRGSGEDFNV